MLHRGVTLGFRVSDGVASVCYLPDHEPALGRPLARAEDDWISGLALARGASLLIHDGQFSDEEYPLYLGWGHSSISDAVAFALRAEAEQVALFHHDPAHTDDQLDLPSSTATQLFQAGGGKAASVELAKEGRAINVHEPTPGMRSARRAVRALEPPAVR